MAKNLEEANVSTMQDFCFEFLLFQQQSYSTT